MVDWSETQKLRLIDVWRDLPKDITWKSFPKIKWF